MNLTVNSINKAHSSERKATLLLNSAEIFGRNRQEVTVKAVQSLKSAADNFQSAAAEIATDPANKNCRNQIEPVLETLRLQRLACLSQIQVLTEQLNKLRLPKTGMISNETETQGENSLLPLTTDSLKEQLLNQISQQDSLIAQLGLESAQKVEANDGRDQNRTPEELNPMVGSKCQKNDSVVMEELKICNDELRRLILTLLDELERKCAEIARLNALVNAEETQSDLKTTKIPNSEQIATVELSQPGPDLEGLEFEPLELPPIG